jgi:hypothetical protein
MNSDFQADRDCSLSVLKAVYKPEPGTNLIVVIRPPLKNGLSVWRFIVNSSNTPTSATKKPRPKDLGTRLKERPEVNSLQGAWWIETVKTYRSKEA